MDVLSELNQRVLPSAFEKKVETSTKIIEKQKNLVVLGRNIFHLLYHLFFSRHSGNDFSIDTLVGEILLEENDYIYSIDPLPTQILINLLKQLFHHPRSFAIALVKANIPEEEFPLIAYTTFPAIFNYFTSLEITESAGFFILDLISAGAPNFMLKHLTCAMLFSTYTFSDCLWCSFARIYENYAFPDIKKIHAIFLETLQSSIQLLPYPLYFILRELAAIDIQLVFDIVFRTFLPVSFHLWYMRSPFALSLGHLSSMKNYFNSNSSWPSDMAVCVINAFIKNRGKIMKIVSFSNQCHLSSETMIFSKRDISVICRMFKPISESISMFNELETIGQSFSQSCYEPFTFAYFHRQVANWGLSIQSFLIDYPVPIYEGNECTLKKTQSLEDLDDEQELAHVYEKAFQQYNDMVSKGYCVSSMHEFFRSNEFLEFKHNKELSLLKLKAQDQEELIFLATAMKEIDDFTGSMKRIYQHLVGCFLKELADRLSNSSKQFSLAIMNSILNAIICGHESLTMCAFIEVLNIVSLKNIELSHKLIDTIIKTLVTVKDPLDSSLKQSRIIAGFPPMLTNRSHLRPGQFFVLLHFIIKSIKEITPQLKNIVPSDISSSIEPIVVLKFVLRMSNCERNIVYFLFFEKILFRSSFIKYVPHSIISDFNLFFQAMWELIGTNYQLLQELILIDLPESLLQSTTMIVQQ